MRDDLPTGTVTLVFTDIEGSTRLLHELGPEAYAEALAEHRRLLREVYRRHGGVEVDTQGDAFFYAFPDAREAVAAADEGREALRPGPIHVRVGMHTGTPHLGPEGYVGHDVHLGARIGAAGHGGQVLVSQAVRAAAALAEEALLDLGEHRLKDFDRPVPIFQLGAERFAPLKTISNTNLPRPASSFVGRRHEVRALTTLIRDDGARLVTLTGPGGSGKTRLSIEAAAELVGDHKAGTFWVELAPIRDSALVTDEIAKTIGAQDDLADHVGEREMLLVLDNLEQVIDAAPALADLVEACPNLAIVATSRERLRVRGEVEYPVAPLAQPDAVELFVARAGLEEPDDAVRRLVRALDEMPLAIELAAARAKFLTPAGILDRLGQRLDLFTGGRDADPRQRTLRSTIGWSHDLLDPAEQRLFARLAVFPGGCTLDSAEAVAEADLDDLQSLVEKSLVRRTNDRYWMYETIREFALERLRASGEADEIGRRHAEHFLATAEEAEPHIRHEDDAWLDRLEPDRDNVRAALDHFETIGAYELQLRVCAAWWHFWSFRGPLPEGRRELERALGHDASASSARARALTGLADIVTDIGEPSEAQRLAEEALALHRSLGDTWGTAYSLLIIGIAFAFQDAWSDARARLEEGMRLFEELGDPYHVLRTRQRLAWAHESLGDLDGARQLHEQNVRDARETGDRYAEARSLSVLAMYSLEAGQLDEGVVEQLETAHRLHREGSNMPDRYNGALILCRFARALALRNEPAAAARLLAAWEAAFEELGMDLGAENWIAEMNEPTRVAIATALGDEVAAAEAAKGRRLSVDDAVALAVARLRS
ncbi:MAG TPA: tetratricopeptide repeat protein [Actinomycetota bacterium]|nr:tetratricopeptide repeat protein [Actinomycetota bacterium]